MSYDDELSGFGDEVPECMGRCPPGRNCVTCCGDDGESNESDDEDDE